MKLEDLIGQTYLENEFYELLLSDIEDNYEKYSSKYIHIYFDRIETNKIRITNFISFEDSHVMNKKSKEIIEKKEWFEISQNDNHFNLLLCRLDRTGFISAIFKDSTHTEDWSHGWADEGPDLGPMTPEEIRLGFLELAGFFEDQQELQKLRSKKAA